MKLIILRLLGLALTLLIVSPGCGPDDELPRVPGYAPTAEAPTTEDPAPLDRGASEPVLPGSPAGVNMPE